MGTTKRRLGRYEILDCIGKGGMGEVYRARDERLGRIVALKILHPELAERTDFRHRFEREAKMLARLNHPNICTLHDFGHEEGVDFLVLECLAGESLASRLRATRLPILTAITYALQIAEALAAAHRVGLVHRDLKPSNVFVTPGGAKLLDFGIARSIALPATSPTESPATTYSATPESAVFGTPGYIAPEVFEGELADARGDIFSYGAVLFEMFAGRRAFSADDVPRVYDAVLREDAPLLRSLVPDIPRALERLVANCLLKDREARWQSAHDACLELRGLDSQLAESRHTPSPVRIQAGLHRLTFNRGTIYSARFMPDSRNVVYSAAWEGAPIQVYLTTPESPESRPLEFGQADLLAISAKGHVALSLNRQVAGYVRTGVLAKVPFAGSEPRRLMDDVLDADWMPDGERLIVVRRVGGDCQLEWPAGRMVYKTAGLISHPRLSRDGRLLAFLDHPHYFDDEGAVVVSDGTTPPRIISDGWRSVWGLAWSPDNREVWFTAAKGGLLQRAIRSVALSGEERVIAQTTSQLTLHDVAPTGDIVVSHDLSRTAVLFRGDDERVETDLSYLDSTFARDLSADGTMLLFDETGDGGGPDYSVYVRPTAGGAAVRIGSGAGRALSPDKLWAATVPRSQGGLTITPTGIGESFTLQHPEVEEYRGAGWLPDGQHIVFSGGKRGRALQLFVHNVTSKATRAISSEHIMGPAAIAPDGRHVIGINTQDRSIWLLSLESRSAPKTIQGITAAEMPAQWSADGSALYLRRRGGEMPLRVHRFDLSRGERALWKEITISDRAGVQVIGGLHLTPDARNYVISYSRVLSDLFLMSGVT